MQKVYEYHTEQERQDIINQNLDLFLIEERNITEGNFLVFSDTLPEREIVYINVPKDEIDNIKQAIAELTIILGGASQ